MQSNSDLHRFSITCIQSVVLIYLSINVSRNLTPLIHSIKILHFIIILRSFPFLKGI